MPTKKSGKKAATQKVARKAAGKKAPKKKAGTAVWADLYSGLPLDEAREYSKEILKGLTAGVSHFHAVLYMKNQLKANGFIELREVDKFQLKPGCSYYFTRNQTTIVAFTVGQKCAKGIELFKVVGCHTDSPVLRLAPHTKIENKFGFQ